jgi:DNA ligase-1
MDMLVILSQRQPAVNFADIKMRGGEKMTATDTSENRKKKALAPCKIMLTLLCWVLFSIKICAAVEIMLPQVYSEQISVSGWLMSEKLDGVRGYWDGKQMLSKNGHLLHPPKEFTRNLPPFHLEGELWKGRGQFESTAGIVMKHQPHAGWLQLKFAIFDVPEIPGGFTQRISIARNWFTAHPTNYAFIIEQNLIQDQQHLQRELQRIEAAGGEGLIIRNPDALYAGGRSPHILKIKSYQDAEATVVAQLPGKGRNKGRLGALLVRLENGTEFKIGSGFNDEQRKDPPPIGSVVTFKFYGLYNSGIPKFPSFVRLRKDEVL